MAKKSQKQAKGKKGKKKQQSKPAAKSTSMRMQPNGIPMALAMGACSISNPFCPEAIGARWPDNSFTKSNSFSFSGERVSLTSNASGAASVLFTAALSQQYYAGTMTGTTAAYTTGNGLGTFANISRYRITSWGIKIQCASPMMTTTGTLNIRLFSPQLGTSLASINTVMYMADASYDIPMNRLIGNDIHVIPMPLGVDARRFIVPDAGTYNITSWTNPGWQAINVATSDALASTVVCNVYCYYNYEFVPADGDILNAYAIAPPADSPLLRGANAGVLERVGNFIEGAATKVDNIFKSNAMKYIAAAGGAYFGGPSGAAAGYSTALAVRGRAVD